MPSFRKIAYAALLMFIGLVLGGFLYTDTQPRSYLRLADCGETCMTESDFMGLAASIVFNRMPGVLPGKVMETDKSIVVLHPKPVDRFHYMIIPKRDIRDIAELSDGDEEYLVDAYAVAAQLLRDNGITKYRMWASGPDYQALSYLHFHVTGS